MQPESPSSNQQPGQWQFVPEQNNQAFVGQAQQEQPLATQGSRDSGVRVSWTASEFIAYQKGAGWYLAAFLVLLVLAALMYAVTRDMISTVATIIIGVLFVGFAARKPRVLTYEISDHGVKIGQKLYAFSALKSFAVIDEGTLHSIDLLPLQRFMPAISMYYEPQDEDKIVEVLGTFLPHEERKQPFIDKIMHRIRF